MKTCMILGAIGAAVAAPSALAGILHHSDLALVSNQVVDFDGVQTTVTSTPNPLQRKTVNGVTAIGINKGNVSGEIDGNEKMKFAFDQGMIIDEITIAFLFDDGQFGDQPAEVARISTDQLTGILSVTGPTTATWTANGTVQNLSVATERGAGVWRVFGEDLFGGAITTLELSSGNPGNKARHGDFSFVSLGGTVIPAPGSVALLGMGGLLAARRRRA